MTGYKSALVLLNDLEKFAGNHDFPEAENLIAQARQALDKDFSGELPSVREPKYRRAQSLATRQ